MQRRDKHNYYLDIAQTVAERGTCLRRNYGAIIVNNDEIVSTGYVGAPRGRKNCIDIGRCIRTQMNIPRGERYELCRSVHAEANAIISAPRTDTLGGRLYLVGIEMATGTIMPDSSCCAMCAGIIEVIIRDSADCYRVIEVEDWIKNDDSLTGVFGY